MLEKSLAGLKTSALLISREGELVWEWYAEGFRADRRHYTASLAKAIVGGISLLLALDGGHMQPDDPAWKHIPEWKEHPVRSRITIRHLATHTSGIEDAEQENIPHAKLSGWKGAFWRREPDPFSIALREAPVIFEPGTKYHYSNPGMAALAYAVTASLKGAPQTDIEKLLRERIMAPLGIPADHWQIGYGRAYELDGLKLYANWGGGSFTPRAVARIGEWMRKGGEWGGKRLVDARLTDLVTQDAGMPGPNRRLSVRSPASGLCWWTNRNGAWPGVPRDAFAGAGAGHQILLVVPSLRLVAVRNGDSLGEGNFWGLVYRQFFSPLMEAIPTTAQ
jgi:CubicO group peptidase (beta-lactamase class C family)